MGTTMLFMGMDLGTQGSRCIITDEKGDIKASHAAAYKQINVTSEPNRYEQNADHWMEAAFATIACCIAQIAGKGCSADEIVSISIDGTSGTIVALGQDGRPLDNALMYNDMRAAEEAASVHEACQAVERKMGFRFNASFSLPRILWLKNHRADLYRKTVTFAHQSDYIVGLLCGVYNVSDYSNALKMGYDLVDGCWPEEISSKLGLDRGKLPQIVAPGVPIAAVSSQAAAQLGLSARTMIVGGSTDGYASALAAGAISVGCWASIIGTSFVLKGVTDRLIVDPSGSCYSHRLPSGTWMIGGASNIGGRCLNKYFGKADFPVYDPLVDTATPTGIVCYPLTGTGERFPFVDPQAEAFFSGQTTGLPLFAALMEGVAFAERLAFERMIQIGCQVGEVIYTSGGACRNDGWLRIRASILNRQLKVPATVDAAMGSAILAAALYYPTLDAASANMIHFSRTIDPVAEKIEQYEDLYGQFYQACQTHYKMF